MRSVPPEDARTVGRRRQKSLQDISRRALENLEEKGLSTLFLTFGMATWPATDGGRPSEAPVLLFYVESFHLAEKAGLALNTPRLEVRIGPLYPTETLIIREKISEFLSDSILQYSIGFQDRALRHPWGALLSRNDETARYLNIGELGTIHYLEPLLRTSTHSLHIPGGVAEGAFVYPLWWITHSLLRIMDVASTLMNQHGVSCNLRIEAKLENVSLVPFTLSLSNPIASLPVSTLSAMVPASAAHSSETLAERVEDVTVELLYQIRWPFGKDKPHTREQIRPMVAQEHPNARVPYSNALGR